MLTRSLFLLLLLANGWKAKFLRFVERCPTRSERQILSLNSGCVSPEMYHCARDDDLKLVEICNEVIQLPPGNYPRYTSYTDRIFYDICPDDRHQPWPVKSNEITECEVETSSCNGVGQLKCEKGTTTDDVTCRCDFTIGFVIRGSSTCCSPSSTDDCYCEYRPCQNSSQELNADYKCVDKCITGYERKRGQEICGIFEYINSTETTNRINSTVSETMYSHEASRIDTIIRITFGVTIVLFVVIEITITASTEVWKLFQYKLIFLWFIPTIVCFAIGILFVEEQIIVKVAFSILLFTFLCVLILIYCVLDTHHLQVTQKTFGMKYHVKIYQLLDAASEGNLDVIKRLRDERYIDLNDTDYDKRSALHLAASEGQLGVVKYLLKHRFAHVNAVDRWNNTATKDAERRKSELQNGGTELSDCLTIVQMLEKQTRKKELPRKDIHLFREQIANKLIHAAETGDLTRIQTFHQSNTDMDLSDLSGRTALQAAVDTNQTEVIEYLLNTCNVSPFVKWNSKRPIGDLPETKRTQLLRNENYFEKIAKDNSSKEEKTLLLLLSASRGDIRRIRGYKKAEFDMNSADYDNRTALHIAVSEHQEHIVEYLIQVCNVNINVKDRWGRTALDEATEKGKRDLIQIFRLRYKDITDTLSNEYKTFQLVHAGSVGNTDELKSLKAKRFDMDMRDYDGRTALHLAAAEGHLESVQFLIGTCKVKSNIPDRNGRTPAQEAEKKYNKKNEQNYDVILEILKDAQKSYLDGRDKDPLEDINPIYAVNEAVGKANAETVNALSWVYMDAGDYLRETPLHVAAAKGQLTIVEHLVEKQNVSLFVRNSFWETPIGLARKKRTYWKNKLILPGASEEKEKNLVQKQNEWDDYGNDLQSDSDSENNSGNICEMQDKHIYQRIKLFNDVSKYLCQKMRDQINYNIVDKDQSLCKYKDEERTFLFLNKISRGDIGAVKRFVATDKLIVHKFDYDLRTALHIAVSEGHYHLVIYLFNNTEVETEAKDRWGNTPKDDAEHNKDFKMIQIINKYSSGSDKMF